MTTKSILSARGAETIKEVGYHAADTARTGLYLQVRNGANGLTRGWILRYTSPLTGKRREMGLGTLKVLSLAQAREKATEHRKAIAEGHDPIETSKHDKLARKLAHDNVLTFSLACKRYIKINSPEWKNAKHAAQWSNTLATYAEPILGDVPVARIDTRQIVRVLEPIWLTKTETATRVRQRIEKVLDWCKAGGYMKGENPARYKGHIETLLPRVAKIKKVVHHPAVPYSRAHEFVSALRAKSGVSALALEFLILTAARTGEVIGATWDEIDFDAKVWTVPASRMKAGKEHRVPLNDRALKILETLQASTQGQFIFCTGRGGLDVGISNAAMLGSMKDMPDFKQYVPHGFRSTFRDWAAEATHHASDTVEMALAHTIENKVEAAYRRGDQLAKRRRLMLDWNRFVETSPAQRASVTNIKARTA